MKAFLLPKYIRILPKKDLNLFIIKHIRGHDFITDIFIVLIYNSESIKIYKMKVTLKLKKGALKKCLEVQPY